MLSIEECRKLLGECAKDMTNERVVELRDATYTIVELVIDAEFEKAERKMEIK